MKKKIVSILLAMVMLCGVLLTGTVQAVNSMPFTDVKEKNWFYDAVLYSYQNGLMNGISSSLFEPDTGMNRAMFVTILGRLSGAVENDSSAFPDIEHGSWYSGYVGWAVEGGVIEGFPDGTFKPFELISRSQMAAAISRYIDFSQIIATRDMNAPRAFADAEDINSWAEDYAERMRVTGIIQGDNTGKFNPNGTLTRAEAATVIKRLSEMFASLELEDPITPSYLADGEDFYLLGAWDMYYSGTALTTSYNASKVDMDSSFPYLTSDFDGRKALYKKTVDGKEVLGNSINTIASGSYFGFNLNILCINPDDYPVIRVGYRISDSTPISFGVYSGSTSKTIGITGSAEEGRNGWSYAIVDLSNSGAWNDDSEEITLTFMAGDADIDISYLTAFKSVSEAEGFDISSYADDIAEYDGAEISYSKIDDATLKKYNKDIDDRIDQIVNCSDDIDPETITGTSYYISSVNGNDSNDGTSPSTPWKSISKLYTTKTGGKIIISVPKTKKGDAVFFERGSVFYAEIGTNSSGNRVLNCTDGVTYAAYGKGDKPLFTNALDIEGSMKWSATEYPNVYKLDDQFRMPDHPVSWGYSDVGSIVINGGEMWGVKILPADSENPYDPNALTSDCGTVTNGKESFRVEGRTFLNPGCLKNNLEYFHDWTDNTLYLYSEYGNPGEIYDSIIVSVKGNGIGAGSNVTLDNLAVKYTGVHGVSSGDCENLIIQNCEFEWIGGCIQGGTTRFGNAIENWGDCNGIFVTDNYINQCYDTGATTQGTNGRMLNMTVSENVIEKCIMAVEFFNWEADPDYDNIMANIFVRDNYIRYNGYGFGSQRSDKKSGFFEGSNGSRGKSIQNVVFENNINLYSSYYCISEDSLARGTRTYGVITKNNVYLMNRNLYYIGRTANNIVKLTGNNYTYYPYTQQYVQYLADIGIEIGTQFYYYDDPISDMEKEGIYTIPETNR